MSNQVPPMWKMRVNDCLKRSNKVNLSGENIDDLEKLGTIKLMQQLDISYVRTIESFEGLKYQPSLKTLFADGSSISSFKNIFAIKNVTALSLKNTPLTKSHQKFNLIASLLLTLPEIKIFNGKLISQKTRQKVESAGYPIPETAQLINAGWIAEYPCPPNDEFVELLKYYGIYNEDQHMLKNKAEINKGQNESIEIEEEEEEKVDFDENDLNEENIDENDQINKKQSQLLIKQQDKMKQKKGNLSGKIKNSFDEDNNDYDLSNNGDEYDADDANNNNNPNDNNDYDYENCDTDNNNNRNEEENNNSDEADSQTAEEPKPTKNISEMSLLEKVAIVLRNNGYQVDQNNMQQSVLNIIDSLCSEMEQINASVPPSEQSNQF